MRKRRRLLTDDEIIDLFNSACRERRSPNVAVGNVLGMSPLVVAQIMHRLRRERPGEVLNGNVAKQKENCPACGSSPSGWKHPPISLE